MPKKGARGIPWVLTDGAALITRNKEPKHNRLYKNRGKIRGSDGRIMVKILSITNILQMEESNYASLESLKAYS